MSRKGKPNKKPSITYPRKCEQCSHLANNPASFSIHKKVHQTIPENQLCTLGCGKIATVVTTRNTYRCSANIGDCPQYINDLKLRTIKSWENSEERKETTRQTFIDACVFNPASYKKASETKHKKLLAQDNTSDRRKYNRQVHELSQRTYRENTSAINPNNLKIGRVDHHLDHKVSKHVGFLLGIPAHYLADINNLCVLPYNENTGKHCKCSIHPLDLLEQCDAPIETIQMVQSKLVQLSHLIAQGLIPNRQTNGFS
jgi:hypothetical protein